MAFLKKLLCWKNGEESEMKGVRERELAFLEHVVNLSSQVMRSETRNTELERRVKELNHERKLMQERLDSEIKKLERQEEDGTIRCAACIIHKLNLTLSQWIVTSVV
jgi:predicted RNase H-like nuclease (RuvC/YqgF family)